MINCSGTLEIRNCTLYYNEIENSPNRINLEGNYTLKIEDSTIICKNYNDHFFIEATYVKNEASIYLINNIFYECINFMGRHVYVDMKDKPVSSLKSYFDILIDSISTFFMEKCILENCVANFLCINIGKKLEIKNCSIIQDKLPKYHIYSKTKYDMDNLFSILGSLETYSTFSNNIVTVTKNMIDYINENQYRYFYSTLISTIDKIENCIFNFEGIYENKNLNFLSSKEIRNSKFYCLENITISHLIDNCYFWACKSIIAKDYVTRFEILVKNSEFEYCYDTIFDDKLLNTEYENNISPYYEKTFKLENCKFSGIKIDNYVFENKLIKLGPSSEIKKCEFINLQSRNFLIDVAIKEEIAKKKKIFIEKCIFKNCSSKTREKNSIIVESNWGFRMIRKDYTYTVTEVKDCQFI